MGQPNLGNLGAAGLQGNQNALLLQQAMLNQQINQQLNQQSLNAAALINQNNLLNQAAAANRAAQQQQAQQQAQLQSQLLQGQLNSLALQQGLGLGNMGGPGGMRPGGVNGLNMGGAGGMNPAVAAALLNGGMSGNPNIQALQQQVRG